MKYTEILHYILPTVGEIQYHVYCSRKSTALNTTQSHVTLILKSPPGGAKERFATLLRKAGIVNKKNKKKRLEL